MKGYRTPRYIILLEVSVTHIHLQNCRIGRLCHVQGRWADAFLRDPAAQMPWPWLFDRWAKLQQKPTLPNLPVQSSRSRIGDFHASHGAKSLKYWWANSASSLSNTKSCVLQKCHVTWLQRQPFKPADTLLVKPCYTTCLLLFRGVVAWQIVTQELLLRKLEASTLASQNDLGLAHPWLTRQGAKIMASSAACLQYSVSIPCFFKYAT